MTTDAEYESALREAARELSEAATADDVRSAWRKHIALGHRALGHRALGHRALGRLLLGRSADELLARRSPRGGD